MKLPLEEGGGGDPYPGVGSHLLPCVESGAKTEKCDSCLTCVHSVCPPSCPPSLLPTLTSSGTRSRRPPITIQCRYHPPPLRSSAGRISNRRPGSYFTVPGARCCHVLIRIQIPRIDCVIRRLQPRPRASIRAVIYCYLHKKKKRKNPFV